MGGVRRKLQTNGKAMGGVAYLVFFKESTVVFFIFPCIYHELNEIVKIIVEY